MAMAPRERAQYKLSSRQKAYRRVFLQTGNDGKIVLEDLANFCHFVKNIFHENSRVTDALIGRREVILRIQEHLQLDDEQIYRLYGNPTLTNIVEQEE